jgi:ribosomal protein L11 methyltransferase
LIRLAVRCSRRAGRVGPRRADRAGAERGRGGARPGYVEYAIYGGEGELPELGEIEAARGDGLVEVVATEVPDDWADRWQDFHKPLLVGGGSGCGPPGRSRARGRSTSSSIPAAPSAPAPTRPRASAWSCCSSWRRRGGDGPLTDLGTGSGVLAIAAAKLGWDPVSGYDHEPLDRSGDRQR